MQIPGLVSRRELSTAHGGNRMATGRGETLRLPGWHEGVGVVVGGTALKSAEHRDRNYRREIHQMSREQNLSAQKLLGELVNSGTLERLGEGFGPDVVDHDPATGQGPGPEGFKKFFTDLRRAFPDLVLEVDSILADDDQVAIAYRIKGTHQGDFNEIAPTGRAVEARGVQLAKFRDGLIVERWGSSDELSLVQQLGATVTA